MDDRTKNAITQTLIELSLDMFPDAAFVEKYGGQLIQTNADDPDTQVGGIFAYTNHVTLELSQGALLDDPDGVLEGKGKFRRHIKLSSVAEIVGKGVREMLQAANELNG